MKKSSNKKGRPKGIHTPISHGFTSNGKINPTYQVWIDIFQRCNNIRKKSYKNYGSRGIKICKEWSSFEIFLKDMGEKPVGMTLERIKNSMGYYKQNCKWASRKEQARNRRTNILISFKGKTQCISAWAEELGLVKQTLAYRLKNWSLERALKRT